jgi:hypothetical protein
MGLHTVEAKIANIVLEEAALRSLKIKKFLARTFSQES